MTYLFPSVKELPCSPDPNDATYLPLISSSCTVTKCMCVFCICVTGSIAYIAFSLVVSNKAIFAQCCLHLVILVLTTISAMVSFGICVIVNL